MITNNIIGLSSYKLVQFLKNYVNPQGVETPIIFRSHRVRRWLCKLGYEYKDVHKDVHKDVFVDGHEQTDVVEDRKSFLKKMKELKPYMVDFYENGAMKPKTYPPNCAVKGEN